LAENKKRDITEVVKNYLCNSCGTCFASCGHDSISYNTTSAGYLFPSINYDSCTNCGLCFDVCPGEHFNTNLIIQTPTDPFVGESICTYTGKATNKEIYLNSQSGGITTAILQYLLDKQIVSAVIVTSMEPISLQSKGMIVTDSTQLHKSQKSKYIPTTLNELLPQISKIDGKVAIVGLPCHMHGIENFYKINKKLKEKIIKIGLICEKVTLYSAINFFTTKITDNDILEFCYKDPQHTKYPGDIRLTTKNGEMLFLDRKYRKTMKDFFTPVRCMLCFDKMNIYSDITLGDPHGIENIDRENGESLVISRTKLGEEIIKNAIESKYINLNNTNFEDAIKGQGIENKKLKFNAYINAYTKMGYTIPKYPEAVLDGSIIPNNDDINKALHDLRHSLSLDKINSIEEVILLAQQYYEKKTKKKTLFEKIKSLFKN
jgi:coenzyme F420 hydrogenase subunit beta